MRHIWAPAEQLPDVHLQNLTAWMQQRRLHYLQLWATVELKAAWSKIIVLSWQFWIGLTGFFFFKNPSYNFQCICVLWWPIYSVLRGTNQISHTSLPAVITATKCKICSKVRNWKTQQECCVISHCIHSSAVPVAVKSLFVFGVDLIGIILYYPPYTLIYDICILYVSQ